MSTTRTAAPLASIPNTGHAFTFPQDRHLLITTPRHIFAWDEAGVHEIFRSSKGGIVAAREAKDGSGMLAIASRNVVVMHDPKRGKDESWGLNAPEDEVRHLEYSNDAKWLFLSNTSDGTIQHYSVERSRLLSPAHQHTSSPAAVAISAIGHMLLAATCNPPGVSLKSLSDGLSETRMIPAASSASVCCAAFHPERPNIFMLAFRNGTVAAYDATRISKDYNSSSSDGEISSLPRLHRTVISADQSLGPSTIAAPVAAVAFLPGFKTRAVSAGHDGRCRLVDFANSGVVLRTWHAKAPLTSLSVLASRQSCRRPGGDDRRGGHGKAFAPHTIGGPTSTESVIAVGRIDGRVLLYDTLGLSLAQRQVSSQEEPILSVEWVRGASPIHFEDSIGHFSDAPSLSLEPGLPADLRPLNVSVGRQFTLHPDEIDGGTVRRKSPSPQHKSSAPLAASQHSDLFSPVKSGSTAITPPARSPTRIRPRISSTTFVKTSCDPHQTDPRKLSALTSDSHATSSSSATRADRVQDLSALRPPRRVSNQIAPLSTKRHITFVGTGGDASFSRQSTLARLSKRGSKLVADLENADRGCTKGKQNDRPDVGVVSYGGRTSSAARTFSRQKALPLMPGAMLPQGEGVGIHGDPGAPPSVQEDASEEEIWFTSDSEDERQGHAPRRPLTRPPERATSRSQMNSKGTMSTAALDLRHASNQTQQSMVIAPERKANSGRPEATPSEEMVSAEEHLSPEALFSPGSENINQLFPRSSSLSPRPKNSPHQPRTPHNPKRDPYLSLTAQALNAAIAARQNPATAKSPWARARARRGPPQSPQLQKRSTAVRKNEFVTVIGDGSVDAGEPVSTDDDDECLACAEPTSRLARLEAEVSSLKGEVAAMKNVLMQNGMMAGAGAGLGSGGCKWRRIWKGE